MIMEETELLVDERVHGRKRWHFGMALVCLAVSFAFYSGTMDNGFWHGEDFQMLRTVQGLASDPSQLLEADVIERHVVRAPDPLR